MDASRAPVKKHNIFVDVVAFLQVLSKPVKPTTEIKWFLLKCIVRCSSRPTEPSRLALSWYNYCYFNTKGEVEICYYLPVSVITIFTLIINHSNI